MEYAIVNNEIVKAEDVIKGTTGICPVCKDEMVVKAGEIVKPYFSHKNNRDNQCELKYHKMLNKIKEEKKKSIIN